MLSVTSAIDRLKFGCWLVVLRINVDLAIFQPYLDLEAGDNQSLKIQVARPGIDPLSPCSASQEPNHSATAAPDRLKSVPQRPYFPFSICKFSTNFELKLF